MLKESHKCLKQSYEQLTAELEQSRKMHEEKEMVWERELAKLKERFMEVTIAHEYGQLERVGSSAGEGGNSRQSKEGRGGGGDKKLSVSELMRK